MTICKRLMRDFCLGTGAMRFLTIRKETKENADFYSTAIWKKITWKNSFNTGRQMI